MQIIVIRHATTSYNERELINGTIDEELSPKGVAQLDDLVKSLKDYSFDVTYSSPLKRAVQTATPIANHYHTPLKINADLIEVSLGSFNGKGWNDTKPTFGLSSSELLSTCTYDFSAYGGERADFTKARIEHFLADIKKGNTSRPLIVTHGGIIRWFYYLCTGQKHGRVPNTSVHTFTV